MTDDKIREVLNLYEGRVITAVLPKLLTPDSARLHNDPDLLHLLTMIPKMRAMMPQPQICAVCGDSSFEHGTFGFRDHAPRDANGDDLPDAPHWDQGQREKLMRWLGFMQGVLFSKDVYTIDELRAHNMPSGAELRPR